MTPRAERRAAPKTTLASDTKAPKAVRSLELFEAEAAARRSLKAGHAAEASWSILSWSRKGWGEVGTGDAGSPAVAASGKGVGCRDKRLGNIASPRVAILLMLGGDKGPECIVSPWVTIRLVLGGDKRLSDIASPQVTIPLTLGGDKRLGDTVSPQVTISLMRGIEIVLSCCGDKRLGDIASPRVTMSHELGRDKRLGDIVSLHVTIPLELVKTKGRGSSAMSSLVMAGSKPGLPGWEAGSQKATSAGASFARSSLWVAIKVFQAVLVAGSRRLLVELRWLQAAGSRSPDGKNPGQDPNLAK